MPPLKSVYFKACLFLFFVIWSFAGFNTPALAGEKPGQVVVAVGADSSPYYFLDRENQSTGLVVDLWKLWSEKTGIKVIFRPSSFSETLTAVKTGEADVQAGCFYNEERDKYLDFVSSVTTVQTHFFFRRNIFGVKHLEDLRGFRIGIIKGDAAIAYLKKKMPKAALAVYPDNISLFNAVEAGDIVAFVKDTNIALVMLAQRGLLNQFRYHEQDPLYQADWFCAVRKGNKALALEIEKGMAAITPAEKQTIIHKWTGVGSGDAEDVLTIGCSLGYPPMSMISESGNPSGMLVDLWQLWARKTGQKIRFRFFNWEDSLRALETGSADIHSGLFYSGEREKQMAFSRPFYQIETGFFFRHGPDAPKALKDLDGRKVGADAGTVQLAHLKEHHKSVHAVSVPSGKSLIKQALENRFDAFLAELPTAAAQLERRGERGMFGLLEEGRFASDLHAGVAKGNPSLLELVNKGFEAITPREMAEIESRWIRDPGLRRLDPSALLPRLNDEEKAWLKENPVIPIAGESDWPPLDFADDSGEYAGVAADYIRLISKRLGVRFEVITDYTWSQMLALARARKIPGIACIAKQKEREEYLSFTRPYFVCPYVIVTHRDFPEISGIQSLFGKTVAIEDGYLLHGRLKSEYPQVTLSPEKNTLDALDAVRTQKAEAYIGNLMVIKHLIREKGLSDLKVAAPSPWPGSKLRIGIRKDWPILVSVIDKAIASLTSSEHRAINQRWLEGGSRPKKSSLKAGFSPEEEDWLDKNKVVIVASESNWPPINFVDSQGFYKGVTADYLSLVGKRLGLRLEVITDYSWNQMVEMARNRQVDLISAIVKNRERQSFLEFSDPYFVSPYVVVTKRSMPRIDSIRDLDGKTMAVEKGFFLHKQMEKEFPDIKLLTTENTVEALEAVADGRAHAYAGNLMVIRYLFKTQGIQSLKVACPAPWPGSQLRLGIRKDWPQLASLVNKALADITAEEHQAINIKWMDYIPPGDETTLVLTPGERAWLENHPDLRLGIDPDWPPFEFLSDKKKYAGLASAYMEKIQKRLGIGMDVQKGMTWQQALEKGRNKEIDIFPCITPSPARAGFFNFTKPYLTFPMVIAARSDFPFISSLDELEGKKTAVVKGYISHETLEQDHRNLDLIKADSVEDALKLVSHGKADAFVGNLASITYYSKKMGLTNVKIAGATPYNFNLSIGVRKDWPELVAILDKALDAIPEKDKDEIRNEWIAMRFEHGVNWGLLWKWILGMALVSGTILGIILYANQKLKQEVNERKRAQDALKETEERSRLILESVGEGILGQDARGCCTFVNQAALTMLGLHRDDLLGKPIHETIHHSKPDRSPYPCEECPMCTGKNQGNELPDHEVIWRRDGSSFLARYRRTRILNQGRTQGSVIVFRDITLKKKAEDELRKLSKAVEQSPVSVVITDTRGRIEYVNSTFSRVTGYSVQEAMGQNPRILKSETTPPAVYKALWETITAGRVWQGELQNKKKNGELIWEAVNISPIFSSKGEITHFLGVKEDITRRKEMEASLMESHEKLSVAVAVSKEEKKKAEAADRAKSEFLANMSHEIRTPMNAIIGMTHLALQTDLDPRQMDYITKIDASAGSLLGLINDILDFSKIEAGKLDMEALEFSLDETMENLASLITVKAREKQGLEVLFRVDPSIPKILVGDPLRLNQVLVNLGNNAVKFTEKGHILVEAALVERSESRVSLAFSVQDTGIGMDGEQQKKLFKAFSQGDTSTTRKYGGTGLGLIISKRIVTMMGGEISLKSRAGEGSTFSFTLSFEIGTGPEPSLPELTGDIRDIRVLIIDDNAEARQIISEMLGLFSLKSREAGSGEEGLSMVQGAKQPYDLVLIDQQMPGMNGIETAAALKKLVPEKELPRIILVSTHEDERLLKEAKALALDGMLIKPPSHSSLLNAVMSAFGKADVAEKLVSRRKTGRVELTREVLGARILLVEDHDINQQVAMEILESAGFFVEIAADGQEGLSMALSKSYDLVLMDLQMPVMDGYESCRRIRIERSAEELPIIAMTASAMPRDRERAMAAGMNAHVSKPIDLGELFRALLKWIPPGTRPLPAAYGARSSVKSAKGLADVPGIAVKQALSRLDNNQDLYLGLLEKFKRDFGTSDQEIKEMADQGDIKTARRTAHSIKGVSGNIGILELQQAAADLEKAFHEEESGAYEGLLQIFSHELSKALAAVEQVGGGAPGADRERAKGDSPGTAEALKEQLLELSPFIREREAKPAKQRMQEIAAGSWPEDVAPMVAELGRMVSGYKFKQAEELAEQLIQKLEEQE